MGNPVIIDDGGSTRIRHHRIPHDPVAGPVGAMDGLLDVQPVGGIGQSDHSFNGALGNFTTLKVSFIDPASGVTTPVAGIPALLALDKVEIVSGRITVRVDIRAGAGGASILTIVGSPGVDPVVDAKQHKKRRRYIVSNAPPIDTVTVTSAGIPTVVFNSAVNDSLYTNVHLT